METQTRLPAAHHHLNNCVRTGPGRTWCGCQSKPTQTAGIPRPMRTSSAGKEAQRQPLQKEDLERKRILLFVLGWFTEQWERQCLRLCVIHHSRKRGDGDWQGSRPVRCRTETLYFSPWGVKWSFNELRPIEIHPVYLKLQCTTVYVCFLVAN